MKKTKKVITRTTDAQIKSALRLLWLRSRERAAAVKRDKNTCQKCEKKASVAKGREVKTEVHHLQEGDINWQRIFRVIRAELLPDPKMLITLCKQCHKDAHDTGEL